MAQKRLYKTGEGYKDNDGRTVVYPRYEGQSESEYAEVVGAAKSGKGLSSERQRQIQANIDKASMKRRVKARMHEIAGVDTQLADYARKMKRKKY